jgi:hypothetical protein
VDLWSVLEVIKRAGSKQILLNVAKFINRCRDSLLFIQFVNPDILPEKLDYFASHDLTIADYLPASLLSFYYRMHLAFYSRLILVKHNSLP